MKKNILVLDSSIMIQKIIKLAFPEDEYNILLSGGSDYSQHTENEVEYAFITADLPGEFDGYEVGKNVKLDFNCPVVLMVPKFVKFDEERFKEFGIDGYIEKPFTSDVLKEKVSSLAYSMDSEEELNEIDSLTTSELESIAEDEFLLSEEDLMNISDEDLGDIGFGDDLSQQVDLPDDSDLDPETADLEESTLEEIELSDSEIEEGLDGIDFQDDIEEIVLEENEFSDEDEGALEDSGENDEPVFDELDDDVFGESKEESDAIEFDINEDKQTGPLDDYKLESQDEVVEDRIDDFKESSDIMSDDLSGSFDEPVVNEDHAVSVPDDDSLSSIVDSEVPESFEVSEDDEEAVIISPPSSLTPIRESVQLGRLSDNDVNRIAEKVVEILSDKAIKDIAWEVIPQIAEAVVKKRIKELEEEVE